MSASSVSAVALLLFCCWVASSAAADVPADRPSPEPAIGMPGCATMCGNVSVPYPFGMGPPHCYMPGFNLTCDHGRLLLGEFVVADVFLNGTMRVLTRDVRAIDMSSGGGVGLARWGRGLGDTDGPYAFGTLFINEFVLTGCNVEARLLSRNGSSVVGACSTYCYTSNPGDEPVTGLVVHDRSSICSGVGCCQASIGVSHASYDARVTRVAGEEGCGIPVHALVVEMGWLTPDRAMDLMTATRTTTTAAAAPPLEVPVILTWRVRSPVEARDPDTTLCMDVGGGDYMCWCMAGYKGNPYLPDGCQDFNQCELPAQDIECFGECTDLRGSYECRCPPGTSGDHTIPGGCVKSSTDKHQQEKAMAPHATSGPIESSEVDKQHLPLWREAMARLEDKFDNKEFSPDQTAKIFKLVIQQVLQENAAESSLLSSDQVAV